MTTAYAALTPNERAALTCILTMTVGLFIGAAVTWWRIRTPQTVLDDLGVAEYEAAADEPYDQELDTPIYADLAIAALRRDLNEWGRS